MPKSGNARTFLIGFAIGAVIALPLLEFVISVFGKPVAERLLISLAVSLVGLLVLLWTRRGKD